MCVCAACLLGLLCLALAISSAGASVGGPLGSHVSDRGASVGSMHAAQELGSAGGGRLLQSSGEAQGPVSGGYGLSLIHI